MAITASITTCAHANASTTDTVPEAVQDCLKALSARWPQASFALDSTDDGTRYGHFWTPETLPHDKLLNVIVEPTEGGWQATEGCSGLTTPKLALGETMAACVEQLARLLTAPGGVMFLGAGVALRAH
jgi:hypothetical protein